MSPEYHRFGCTEFLEIVANPVGGYRARQRHYLSAGRCPGHCLIVGAVGGENRQGADCDARQYSDRFENDG